MARTQIDLNPVDFITIGTIGPKGRRVFHLQAGSQNKLVSFTIEKEQAWALSEAIKEFISDLDERLSDTTSVNLVDMDMELREPIQPLFRIAQMGLAYDDAEDKIILIAQEMVVSARSADEDDDLEPDDDSGVVRMWCTREQMKALSAQAMDMVESGRPSPKLNGRITYYWT